MTSMHSCTGLAVLSGASTPQRCHRDKHTDSTQQLGEGGRNRKCSAAISMSYQTPLILSYTVIQAHAQNPSMQPIKIHHI